MKNNTNIISQSYSPAWEGETESGVKKRIYCIVGKIKRTYRRLIDKNGIYLDDENGNHLVFPNKYNI